MIKIFAAVCFLFWDLNAYAAISLVQQAVNSGSTGTNPLIVTLGSTPAAGHALVACVAIGFDTYVVTSITGGGVTWYHAVTSPSSGPNDSGDLWYGLNATGSGTTAITIFVSSATKLSANVSEWSGLGTWNIVNATNTSTANGTSILTGAVTTALAKDLIIGCGNVRGATITGGPANGFTALTNYDESTDIYARGAYLITASAGTYSTSWPFSTSEIYTGRIAAFSSTSGNHGFTKFLK